VVGLVLRRTVRRQARAAAEASVTAAA